MWCSHLPLNRYLFSISHLFCKTIKDLRFSYHVILVCHGWVFSTPLEEAQFSWSITRGMFLFLICLQKLVSWWNKPCQQAPSHHVWSLIRLKLPQKTINSIAKQRNQIYNIPDADITIITVFLGLDDMSACWMKSYHWVLVYKKGWNGMTVI